jgi:protease-4
MTLPAPTDVPDSCPQAAGRAARLPCAGPAGPRWKVGLERMARELLRQRRTERRWRMFFRLAWLGLAAGRGLGLFVPAHRTSPASPRPHTALVEVRGEIAADTEASAELHGGRR